jgi:hypothetical protein
MAVASLTHVSGSDSLVSIYPVVVRLRRRSSVHNIGLSLGRCLGYPPPGLVRIASPSSCGYSPSFSGLRRAPVPFSRSWSLSRTGGTSLPSPSSSHTCIDQGTPKRPCAMYVLQGSRMLHSSRERHCQRVQSRFGAIHMPLEQ